MLDQIAEEVQLSRPRIGDRLRWLGDLAISMLIAVPYAMSLLGSMIWPTNISWLTADAAMGYIAWTMLRLGGGWHWPLTYTAALGYPLGTSISLVDPAPIVAVLLRPFSGLLPVHFQYFGLYAVLCLILQLFFGVRLLRCLLPGKQVVVWLGGLFFLIAPPMTFRFGASHFAAASHWVILAALLVYMKSASGAYSVRGLAWRVAVLTIVVIGINPYIAAIVVAVLVAACVAAVLKRYITVRAGLGVFATIVISSVLSAGAFGLIGSTSHEFIAEGYRFHSMNLLAPIDPSPIGSPVLPSRKTFTAGQYEGYNYLGAGTLALLILAVFLALTGRIRIKKEDVCKWAPVAVCGVLCTVLALSTLVSMGDQMLVDLDPNQRLTPFLAVLRGSGRLFWLPYYLITAFAVISTIRFLKPRDGVVILAAVLVLQIYDTGPVRQYARNAPVGSPPANLTSAVWRTLNLEHRNLMVLPAWQCRSGTPGDGDGFRIFGLLAADQGLTINSYYVVRFRQEELAFHCNTVIDQVSREGLSAHTAYVVSPEIARKIASSKSGDDHCYSVDGFILCTLSKLAGVAHWRIPTVPLGNGILTAQDSGYFVSGWEPAVTPVFGLWSVSPKAVVTYHGAAQPAKSLRLTMMAPAGINPVAFSVMFEGGRVDGVVPATNPPQVRVFTVRLPIGDARAVHEVTIVNRQLRTPPEQGFKSSDERHLGIGVHSLAADACPPSSTIDFRQTDTPDPACVIK